MIAQDVANYIADETFTIGRTARSTSGAEGAGSFVSYDSIIETYKTKFLDNLGYDVNLILVPDTTYNISLRSYITFS